MSACPWPLASTYNNVGSVYEKQGQYEKALEYCQQSLDMKIRSLDHSDVSRTNLHIANVYESQGKYQEALDLYHKTEKVYVDLTIVNCSYVTNSHGYTHLDVAATYNNIAGVYRIYSFMKRP
jgi:tetratricopeptide (TPR) repeat protein